MDSFALPVEGCETRVNASEHAYGWMVGYSSTLEKVGRLENQIGWYHSHPGYGCWLSGVDVATQRMQQAGMDPYLAIVVDPTQTCAAGKVEIGAFRCYPESYKPPSAAPSEYQVCVYPSACESARLLACALATPFNLPASMLGALC